MNPEQEKAARERIEYLLCAISLNTEAFVPTHEMEGTYIDTLVIRYLRDLQKKKSGQEGVL